MTALDRYLTAHGFDPADQPIDPADVKRFQDPPIMRCIARFQKQMTPVPLALVLSTRRPNRNRPIVIATWED